VLWERYLEHADEVAQHFVDGVLVRLDAKLAAEVPLGTLDRRNRWAVGEAGTAADALHVENAPLAAMTWGRLLERRV
jgi:hypothetical protein